MSGDNHAADPERAMLYAIGALEPAEIATYERHLTGCALCQDEVQAFQGVATGLAYTLPLQTPSENVRTRLMERAKKGTGVTTVRADTPWQPTDFEGIQIRPLFIDQERGTISMLVKMAPGARYPRHRHTTFEESYMIEGDLHIGDTVLLAGDYQRADLDSYHDAEWTENGCIALIIAAIHNELF